MPKKIILDLDTGIDDALAIAYALASPEVELLGITGTFGNVLLQTGIRNDLALLSLFGHPGVPVMAGIAHPSTVDDFSVLEISNFIHGRNGVGNVELADGDAGASDIPAVDFLVQAVREHGDDLVLVPTGPLTNIAAAIDADPDFADNAHIVLMGGALAIPGNVNGWTEANINMDPEAADKVFRVAKDVTMVGLDVTLQTLLSYSDTQTWRDLGTEAGEKLADITDYYIKAYETTSPHLDGCSLHDPLAVAVAIDPSLVGVLERNLKVDLEGPTRGRTIGDQKRLNDPVKTARTAVTVDVDRFLEEFMGRITGLLRR